GSGARPSYCGAMGRVTEIGERLWTGSLSPAEHHPWAALQELEELEPGIAFVSSFANVTGLDTPEGLVLVDTGGFPFAAQVHQAIRRWSGRRLHTAIYTHGHVDHVFGVLPFDEEARTRGWAAPIVVGHQALSARFDRYRRTAALNAAINARQFQVPGMR